MVQCRFATRLSPAEFKDFAPSVKSNLKSRQGSVLASPPNHYFGPRVRSRFPPTEFSGMNARKLKGTVGIVGLGIMGGAFAKNLVEDGWRVIGFDVDAGRRKALARVGVEIAEDTETLAKDVPTIITSLQ